MSQGQKGTGAAALDQPAPPNGGGRGEGGLGRGRPPSAERPGWPWRRAGRGGGVWAAGHPGPGAQVEGLSLGRSGGGNGGFRRESGAGPPGPRRDRLDSAWGAPFPRRAGAGFGGRSAVRAKPCSPRVRKLRVGVGSSCGGEGGTQTAAARGRETPGDTKPHSPG